MHPVWNHINKKTWYHKYINTEEIPPTDNSPIDYFSIGHSFEVDTFSFTSHFDANCPIKIKDLSIEDETRFLKLFIHSAKDKIKQSNPSNVISNRPLFSSNMNKTLSIKKITPCNDMFNIFRNKVMPRKRTFSQQSMSSKNCVKFSTQCSTDHDNSFEQRSKKRLKYDHAKLIPKIEKSNKNTNDVNIFEQDYFINTLFSYMGDLSMLPIIMCLNRSIFESINSSSIWKQMYYKHCYIILKYEYGFDLHSEKHNSFFQVQIDTPSNNDSTETNECNWNTSPISTRNPNYFVRSVVYKKMYHNIKRKMQSSSSKQCTIIKHPNKLMHHSLVRRQWETIQLHSIVLKMCEVEDEQMCESFCRSDSSEINYYCYLSALYAHVKNMPKKSHEKMNCCLHNIFINRHFCTRDSIDAILQSCSLNQEMQDSFKYRNDLSIGYGKSSTLKYVFLPEIISQINNFYVLKHFEETSQIMYIPIQYTLFYDLMNRIKVIQNYNVNCVKMFFEKECVSYFEQKLFDQQCIKYGDIVKYSSMHNIPILKMKINEPVKIQCEKIEFEWEPDFVSFLMRKTTNDSCVLSNIVCSESFHAIEWCLPIEWMACKKNSIFCKRIWDGMGIMSILTQNDFGANIIQMLQYCNKNWHFIKQCLKPDSCTERETFKKMWLFFRNMKHGMIHPNKPKHQQNQSSSNFKNEIVTNTTKQTLNMWMHWKNNSIKRMEYCSNNTMSNDSNLVLLNTSTLTTDCMKMSLWEYMEKNALKFNFRQLYRSHTSSTKVKSSHNRLYMWEDCTFEKLIFNKMFQYKCIHQNSSHKIIQNNIQNKDSDLLYQWIASNGIPSDFSFLGQDRKEYVKLLTMYNSVSKQELNEMIEKYGKPCDEPLLWNLHTDQLCNTYYRNTFFKFEHSSSEDLVRNKTNPIIPELTHKNWYHTCSIGEIQSINIHFNEFLRKNNMDKNEVPLDRMFRSLFVDKKLCRFYNQESYKLVLSSLKCILREKWYCKPTLWLHWILSLSYDGWIKMTNDIQFNDCIIQVLNDCKEKNRFSVNDLQKIIVLCEEKYDDVGDWLSLNYTKIK